MLFNSFEFLAFFLPITLTVYFLLNNYGFDKPGKVWLLVCSLFFYAWWKPIFLLLICTSMVINYFAGQKLNYIENPKTRKIFYITCLLGNLSVLLYYKYTNFIIDNVNLLLTEDIVIDKIALPLAISFFTFQKFAYITDSYKGETKGYDFLNFCLFVAFFPQLIAGPIVHHKDIMPQFQDESKKRFNTENFLKGLYIFLLGLIKKIAIADTFAIVANAGYGDATHLSFADSWITSIAYAVQLYFDFSGYSDMAIGAGLLFNITLPINFNSPYKATNLQDFWRRWHITLGNFLREYIYIPLGGNRKGELLTLNNLMITFLVGGIWHGANWTFLIWGFMHGFGLVVHRLWQKTKISIPDSVGLLITLLYVNFAWVFFRATSVGDALAVLKSMIGIGSVSYTGSKVLTDIYIYPTLLAGMFFLFLKNPPQLAKEFRFNTQHLLYMLGLTLIGLIYLNSITSNDFLYFDF
ncbi:MBOAT family O-acyltransferase [Cytophagaceae bacterium YF14B1]|uniref:MBOAT family O-acyltransferase n=1 Tax=Xanthocytophaga flava TaxID=3048013 RepID=A0AAE3QRS1_9BACT|nr:MBOAT family O-acyltransferase [Xanthocytophaga flavus]MDJ1484272.1 MBOAT family O-acyltransferase [Xanthocytophaga flavus]